MLLGSTSVTASRAGEIAAGADPTTRHIALGARAARLLVSVAIGLGVTVRLMFVLAARFPLNDGGMFDVMIRNLEQARFALPAYTSYNGGQIPYVYPPLGFYLAAAVGEFTHLGNLQLLQYLPALVSCLTLVAFYRLARATVPTTAAIVAVFAFGLLPWSFVWEIMGGGLTRGLGFLFAVLALREVYLLVTQDDAGRGASAGVLAGLTILAHIELAWFLAFSAAYLVAAFVRRWQQVAGVVLAGAVALAVSSPWWATVLIRFGTTPYRAASQTGGAFSVVPLVEQFLHFDLTDESLFSPLAILGVVGIIWCLRSRRYLLPGWILTCIVLDPRKYLTDIAVPLALTVGLVVTEFVIPALTTGTSPVAGDEGRSSTRLVTPGSARASRWIVSGVLGVALVYSVFAVIGSAHTGPVLTTLSPDERAAMTWAEGNTPPSATFLVVTGDMWAVDRSSEWFPALANRVSVATVQGSEWLPQHGFQAREDAYTSAQDCAVSDAACLARWQETTRLRPDFVYVAKRLPVLERTAIGGSEYHWALEYALRADPGYRAVYDGPGAVIFAVLRSGTAAGPHAVPPGLSHATAG